MSRCRFAVAGSLALLVAGTAALAQPPGRGPGSRGGFGRDPRHAADRDVFHFLLRHHDRIQREVKERPDGVETLTASDDPEVAEKIREHVRWMAERIEEGRPIRRRDPLFDELFRHADKIRVRHEATDRGIRVIETSRDPRVVALIQAHARVVSAFVEHGFREAAKDHAVPASAADGAAPAESDSRQPADEMNPVIGNFGGVVPLPDAAQQPRPASKLVIDLTRGGPPGSLNPGVEKIARFVNIYGGAGARPATASMAVVLHGDATLCVLNDEAYAAKFGTDGNPNLACIEAAHEAGVEIYVCGQSLIKKGGQPEDVAGFADVAVSALTSLVNLQADGYAYVPVGG